MCLWYKNKETKRAVVSFSKCIISSGWKVLSAVMWHEWYSLEVVFCVLEKKQWILQFKRLCWFLRNCFMFLLLMINEFAFHDLAGWINSISSWHGTQGQDFWKIVSVWKCKYYEKGHVIIMVSL